MKTDAFEVEVAGEDDMITLGQSLSGWLRKIHLVTFTGDLGAGKTTLVRGILRGRDYHGAVKSPTFTLVEPYELAQQSIYHFDLYRLDDPEEFEFLGAREYLQDGGLCLVEWPEKGAGFLPEPDVNVTINKVNSGRMVRFALVSDRAKAYADELMHCLKVKQEVQSR
ncbi:MAG: tRNA (adenosine(37)-N6)-threonylcarbamoyltransferase complex ATPase subunit type 1 TsaE [Acidiferrobacterales bacterium]|nr:tRNA (adenosine(37)-N6)-threonylcarbamoyltransferase complex ATPase subunit type 1 TsaE [Acidiferrobacterales bacterium]